MVPAALARASGALWHGNAYRMGGFSRQGYSFVAVRSAVLQLPMDLRSGHHHDGAIANVAFHAGRGGQLEPFHGVDIAANAAVDYRCRHAYIALHQALLADRQLRPWLDRHDLPIDLTFEEQAAIEFDVTGDAGSVSNQAGGAGA